MSIEVSIVIPAYNEEKGLPKILPELDTLRQSNAWEIIVVDDGSTDGTADIVRQYADIRLVSQANTGYGGALKRGFREAKGEYILTMDADGQHNPADIPAMVEAARGHDFLTGVRDEDSDRPMSRRPGKWALTRAAELLSGKTIRDLNCGFRVFRRSELLKFIHLFPNGFSLSTTSMISFLKGGYEVHYLPITVRKREGRSSSVRYLRDGFKTLFLIMRITMLFEPMRIFLPATLFFLLAGGLLGTIEVVLQNRFPHFGLFTVLFALFVFLLGLMADMISLLRQGNRER